MNYPLRFWILPSSWSRHSPGDNSPQAPGIWVPLVKTAACGVAPASPPGNFPGEDEDDDDRPTDKLIHHESLWLPTGPPTNPRAILTEGYAYHYGLTTAGSAPLRAFFKSRLCTATATSSMSRSWPTTSSTCVTSCVTSCMLSGR